MSPLPQVVSAWNAGTSFPAQWLVRTDDGRVLLIRWRFSTLRIFNDETGAELHAFQVPAVAGGSDVCGDMSDEELVDATKGVLRWPARPSFNDQALADRFHTVPVATWPAAEFKADPLPCPPEPPKPTGPAVLAWAQIDNKTHEGKGPDGTLQVVLAKDRIGRWNIQRPDGKPFLDSQWSEPLYRISVPSAKTAAADAVAGRHVNP